MKKIFTYDSISYWNNNIKGEPRKFPLLDNMKIINIFGTLAIISLIIALIFTILAAFL